MKKYLLFDLDGTLTDPKQGITTCVQYALQSFGIEEPDLDKLEPFIGPPLKDSFMKFYGMSEEQAGQAVEKYRERFQDTGIFENRVYNGIPQMLRTLQSKGFYLAVASSKPTVYVERILEHFQLSKYFKVVVGSELDGTRVNKDEVVQETLNRLFSYKPVQRDQVYMIGDRKFDVEGAKAFGIESVAVAYGYGSMEELKEAKADYIVRSVEELEKFLLRDCPVAEEKQTDPVKRQQRTIWQNIWPVVFPFLLFTLVRQMIANIIAFVVSVVGIYLPDFCTDLLFVRDETGEFVEFSGNAGTVIIALSFVAAVCVIRKGAGRCMARAKQEMHLTHLKKEPTSSYVWCGLMTVGFAVGLNLFLNLSGAVAASEAFQETSASQYSANLVIGLLCYGVITPAAEEILFRGVIYNHMKTFMKTGMAMLLSAFLFGFYHTNSVQGMYAFAMGCLMAYAYEYFGTFKAPLAMHVLANVLAYLLTETGVSETAFFGWPVCGATLMLGAAGLWMLMRRKKVL